MKQPMHPAPPRGGSAAARRNASKRAAPNVICDALTGASASVDIHETVLALVDHLDAMVAYWDANQVCVFANSAYLQWFGKTKSEMIGLTLEQLLGPLYRKNLPYIQAAYAGRKQVFEREIPTPDGRMRSSLATYNPRLVGGEVRGIFVHVADVTPLKVLQEELHAAKAKAEHLAAHDFLTGLPNRVLLLDRINQALAVARRSHRVVALLSLDLDDFKKVNDTFGHAAGDRLLIELAWRIRGSLRESDTVLRMGGDEFLVLAPEMESKTQVEMLAYRILDRLRQPFQVEDATLFPTCSLGIAIHPEHGTTPEALMASSDRALYAAKRMGKNRCAFASLEDAPRDDSLDCVDDAANRAGKTGPSIP